MRWRSTFVRAAGIAAAFTVLVVLVSVFLDSRRAASVPHVRAAKPAALPAPANAGTASLDAPAVAPSVVATGDAAPEAPVVRTHAVAGMVVGIDPETGQIGMPTREQLKNLSELEQIRLDHETGDLIETHNPDGSVTVDLQGRFQEFATVRTGPDGKLIYQCVEGEKNAERALKNPAPAAQAPAPAPQAEER